MGTPTRQCAMGSASAECKTLAPEQREAYRCVISGEGGQFFWKSRKETRLFKVQGLPYGLYVAENGAGQIRVWPDGSYLEIMHHGDSVIGYWGSADSR